MSNVETMTKLKTRNKGEGVSFFAISSNNCPVMLSEAKHLGLLSLGGRWNKKDHRFFASQRMTVFASIRHWIIRDFIVIRRSCFVLCLLLGALEATGSGF